MAMGKTENYSENKKTSLRDRGTDLLKILACYFVIALHFEENIGGFPAGTPSEFLRNLFYAVFSQGVPLFFIAAGFYFFQSGNFLTRYKKFFLRILLPTFFVILISVILFPWCIGQASFSDALLHPFSERTPWGSAAAFFKNWKTKDAPTMIAHLWYIREYTKCMLFYPLLYFVCREKKGARAIRFSLEILITLSILLSDLSVIFPGKVPYLPLGQSFTIEILLLFAGYEIYRLREQISKKPLLSGVSGTVLFCLTVLFRLFFACRLRENSQFLFFGWENLLSLFGCIGLSVAFISIRGKSSQLLGFLSGRTFTVYLLHLLFVLKIKTRGIETFVRNLFPENSAGAETLILLAEPLLLLVCLLLFSTVLYFLKRGFLKIFRK